MERHLSSKLSYPAEAYAGDDGGTPVLVTADTVVAATGPGTVVFVAAAAVVFVAVAADVVAAFAVAILVEVVVVLDGVVVAVVAVDNVDAIVDFEVADTFSRRHKLSCYQRSEEPSLFGARQYQNLLGRPNF